jgi:predicted transcriptional regulator
VEAKNIVPVGKETDRTWDVGEDMSVVDFKVRQLGQKKRLVQADSSLLKRARAFSKRELIRRCGLSQKAIYAILDGKEVQKSTLDSFVRAVESATKTLLVSRL